MESIKDYKLMAQGGQADIYLYGEDKVLRVLRNDQDTELLLNEIEIMRSLENSDVFVPKVFDYLTVDEKPAVVAEKISGGSMLDELRKHPFTLRKEAETLASLHVSIAKNTAAKQLKSMKERARYLAEKAGLLKASAKEFVYGLIDRLPDGNELCHGDFHPGNILRMDDKNYIIDWFGAYTGDLLSDAAHTYLVSKNVPRCPGISPVQHIIMKLYGSLLANEYLKALRKIRPFSWEQFSKWLVIKAAERISFGSPAEKPRLIQFIEACKQSKTDPGSWYKLI